MSNDKDEILREGYSKSIDLLKECTTEHGFVSSIEDVANYRRVWGRDGSIMSIAALLTDDEELIQTARNTLETLIKQQGPHGEIPSNYDPKTGRISYGGTAGRVDADLWFLISCGQYLRKRKDQEFFNLAIESIEKVNFLLGAWEFNNRGLLYVPMTGDWADEYIHHGYILFDQILYYRALLEVCAIHKFLHKSEDHILERKIAALKNLIRTNYWFCEDEVDPGYIYHKVLYEKGRKTAIEKECKYWYSFFTPAGYGYRFDTLANVLVSLFGIANENQSELVDDYLESEVVDKEVGLLPAFHPVITPEDDHWENLKMSFSYTFKNEPYEFQNGGLWPFITAFYAANLARRGKMEKAKKYLAASHLANKMSYKGDDWSFPEFIHGKNHKPAGIDHLGWNAAAPILAHHTIEGEKVLSGQDYEEFE
jgi:GH15 family glucan-1,4-alpha-glucosidase